MSGDGQPAPVPEKEAGGAVAEEVAEKGKSDPWKLEAQPIREDQVENAVKFLSHPKVRTSPIVHRRSFLERKGLTREEIDESFRRVPDPPSSEAAATSTLPSDVQARASTSQAIVSGPNQGVGQALATKQPTPLSWGQKMLGLGAIVAAGAGAGVLTKVYLLPKFKAWVRSILTEETETDKKVSPSSPGLPAEAPVNETALAANAAAAAALEVAAAMREFSNSRVKESQQLGSIIKALEAQTLELKSALVGMRDLANSSDSIAPIPFNRGYNTNQSSPGPWKTPDMPLPRSVLLPGRTYAGAVAAQPDERIDSSQNESESEVNGS